MHYLVNCAGIITPIGPITTIDLADFLQLMNVNFFAAFQLINVLIPQFADGARVLSASSRAAELHLPGLGMYCVSKAALESLTGAYQVELAKVSVSTCIPGEVDTDMQSDLRSGPQSPSSDPDSLGGFFDQQFFLKNKTRLIPPAISARFLDRLLTGPDSEEFEAKRPWTIYDQEVQPRWLEKGEAFSYEVPLDSRLAPGSLWVSSRLFPYELKRSLRMWPNKALSYDVRNTRCPGTRKNLAGKAPTNRE